VPSWSNSPCPFPPTVEAVIAALRLTKPRARCYCTLPAIWPPRQNPAGRSATRHVLPDTVKVVGCLPAERQKLHVKSIDGPEVGGQRTLAKSLNLKLLVASKPAMQIIRFCETSADIPMQYSFLFLWCNWEIRLLFQQHPFIYLFLQ